MHPALASAARTAGDERLPSRRRFNGGSGARAPHINAFRGVSFRGGRSDRPEQLTAPAGAPDR